MKKIPTVFVPEYNEKGKRTGLSREFTSPETEHAFLHGVPTVKYDGSCAAIIGGVFYKRYDAKPGKTPPEGAIPCCDPDPVTGHWPHWVRVTDSKEDKWFRDAYFNTDANFLFNGTYEAVGPQFNGNPYKLDRNTLMRHGAKPILVLDVPKDYDGIRDFLKDFPEEGIVYWWDQEPVAKIKRTDFGFPWPTNDAEVGRKWS